MNELFSYIRIFIVISIIVGIPLGLAVFYLNNNSGQEAEIQNNLLLLAENWKVEEQETGEGGSEIIAETLEEKTEEAAPKAEQNIEEILVEETNPETVYAPDFVFKDAEGNEMSLSSFRGTNVLLVFWATWCGYCKKELPDLKNFAEKYRDEIIVLTLVNQESPEVVREYMEQEKINFLVLIDESGQIWNSYLVRGTPAHFLIDKEGKVIASFPGYASKEILETMASLVIEE